MKDPHLSNLQHANMLLHMGCSIMHADAVLLLGLEDARAVVSTLAAL